MPRASLSLPVDEERALSKSVAVIAFADFESFPCARSASVLKEFLAQKQEVRVIFKHSPALSNPNSLLAHEAAQARHSDAAVETPSPD